MFTKSAFSKYSMKHVSTKEDQILRREVVTAILLGLCEDQAFGEQQNFVKWQRQHRKLLIGLFGGTGIGNQARLVAWMKRDAFHLRRNPPEILCLLVDSLDDGSLPGEFREAFAHVDVINRTDLITAAMLDATFARSLLQPAPEGGLEAIRKIYFP
jgi:hypothetical protein